MDNPSTTLSILGLHLSGNAAIFGVIFNILLLDANPVAIGIAIILVLLIVYGAIRRLLHDMLEIAEYSYIREKQKVGVTATYAKKVYRRVTWVIGMFVYSLVVLIITLLNIIEYSLPIAVVGAFIALAITTAYIKPIEDVISTLRNPHY